MDTDPQSDATIYRDEELRKLQMLRVFKLILNHCDQALNLGEPGRMCMCIYIYIRTYRYTYTIYIVYQDLLVKSKILCHLYNDLMVSDPEI